MLTKIIELHKTFHGLDQQYRYSISSKLPGAFALIVGKYVFPFLVPFRSWFKIHACFSRLSVVGCHWACWAWGIGRPACFSSPSTNPYQAVRCLLQEKWSLILLESCSLLQSLPKMSLLIWANDSHGTGSRFYDEDVVLVISCLLALLWKHWHQGCPTWFKKELKSETSNSRRNNF